VRHRHPLGGNCQFRCSLDGAVAVNLLGPARVAETLRSLSAEHGTHLPHLVAVSTAYVNSGHKGDAAEELITSSRWLAETDWRAEVAAARRARTDADAESRTPDRLGEFQRRARAELGAAGTSLLADKTERIRKDWVAHRMVDAGRSRAQALGWPDAYAYTKVARRAGPPRDAGRAPRHLRPAVDRRVGPERATTGLDPRLSDGRAGDHLLCPRLLRQFPGVPEGVVDVVPVDLVVATIIAVAARGPDPDGPVVFQIASGTRNPLVLRAPRRPHGGLVHRAPLYDNRGQPIVVPKWSFPGRGKVQGELRRATKNPRHGGESGQHAAPPGRRAEFVGRIEERRSQAERALEYVELYGAYAESEARFQIDRTLALFAQLAEETGNASASTLQ